MKKKVSDRKMMYSLRSVNKTNDLLLHEIEYAWSHGVTSDTNSTLGLVYEFVKLHKPHKCVVIGSGSGLVPRVLREAQINSECEHGKTHLIDFGATYGAIPEEIHNPQSIFRKMYPEISVFKGKSCPDGFENWKQICGNESTSIDILWIDGDHSEKGSLLDFQTFAPLVSENGLIFMHDTAPNGYGKHVPSWCGVHRTLDFIKKDLSYEVLNLVSTEKHCWGAGLAIIKRTIAAKL